MCAVHLIRCIIRIWRKNQDKESDIFTDENNYLKSTNRNIAVLRGLASYWVRSIWYESKVQSDLNLNARMRTEMDLNECEHFLKAH